MCQVRGPLVPTGVMGDNQYDVVFVSPTGVALAGHMRRGIIDFLPNDTPRSIPEKGLTCRVNT